jgi:biopolymer transport protein ExbD
MARKKKKQRPNDMLELNMTAMCDVIFQLLIYLILTAKPMIVLAQLDVNRPSPDPTQMKPEKITGLLEVMVFTDAFVIQTKRVNADGLGKALKQLADIDKTQTVLIKCMWDSPHEKLIQVLDMCSQYGLSNISVMSM